MYADQSGEFVRGYLGLKGKAYLPVRAESACRARLWEWLDARGLWWLSTARHSKTICMAPTSMAALWTATLSSEVNVSSWNREDNNWNGRVDRLLATGEDRIDSTTKTDIGNDRMISELLALHFTASTIGSNEPNEVNILCIEQQVANFRQPFVCFALS